MINLTPIRYTPMAHSPSLIVVVLTISQSTLISGPKHAIVLETRFMGYNVLNVYSSITAYLAPNADLCIARQNQVRSVRCCGPACPIRLVRSWKTRT